MKKDTASRREYFDKIRIETAAKQRSKSEKMRCNLKDMPKTRREENAQCHKVHCILLNVTEKKSVCHTRIKTSTGKKVKTNLRRRRWWRWGLLQNIKEDNRRKKTM